MEDCCKHCEDYYKKGIVTNVKSFLQRLEKGSILLTEEDRGLEEEEETQEENDGVEEVTEEVLIDLAMERELANVCNW